ncbi:DUF4388 domain-containing protein [bacterium]|nr:DUF4388 domain-containing protein [bacterium]
MSELKRRCIKGTIETYGLPSLLLTIFFHRFSGHLEIFQGEQKKVLYFERGNITFAASNNPDDRLGDILLQEGKITQRQYDESVDELKKGKKRQGLILVQRGHLSMHELILSIRHQIKIILSSIILNKAGHFYFYFEDEPIKENVTLRENTLMLLRQYHETETDIEWLVHGVRAVQTVFSYNSVPSESDRIMSLTPLEMKILKYISESDRSLEQLCDWSELEFLDTIKSVHFLIEAHFIIIRNEIWDNPLEC